MTLPGLQGPPGDLSQSYDPSSNTSYKNKGLNLNSFNNVSMNSHNTHRKKSSSKIANSIGTFMLTDNNKELTQIQEELLEAKIYQPYFISHNTIIQFE
jgi:hypothetical protein